MRVKLHGAVTEQFLRPADIFRLSSRIHRIAPHSVPGQVASYGDWQIPQTSLSEVRDHRQVHIRFTSVTVTLRGERGRGLLEALSPAVVGDKTRFMEAEVV